jgi:hypothetical protein
MESMGVLAKILARRKDWTRENLWAVLDDLFDGLDTT